MSPNQIRYGFWGLLRISFVRSMQPWKQTKTGTEVPRLTFLRLDSRLVDADQESPDELHSLTEDDLPSSDGVLHELEECLRQHPQDPGPHSGSDDPSDAA
jgi:hypothetical protein